jgi:DNA phosphorothioation system restriction enzyme
MVERLNNHLEGRGAIRKLSGHYRTGASSLGKEFFAPCLKYCSEYRRAVGYFSSKALLAWLEVLPRFATESVTIHLLISPELSDEDREALETALNEEERQQLRQVSVERLIQETLEDSSLPHAVKARVRLFAWVVANDHLILRFAFPEHIEQPGIFHEKIGIFQFPWGDQVAFTGSANESEHGYERNYESIDVYRSWIVGDEERVRIKQEQFEEAWSARAVGLKVLPLSPESAALIRSKAPDKKPVIAPTNGFNIPRVKENPTDYGHAQNNSALNGFPPALPSWLKLRPYQQQAIANWFANKGKGTLKMATGSGKTITALAIAAELYRKSLQQNKPLQGLLIICPYRHLVTQWAEEAIKFGLQPLLAFETVQSWQGELQSQLLAVLSGNQQFVTVITTNATLIRDSLQSQLQFFPKRSLIIGDEAHNLGATRLESSLPQEIKLRLALSATPERYFDERGTERLFEYFGSVLEPEFTLKDAIAAKALVPYLYYPVLVELTEPEIERYEELTSRIGRAIRIGGDADDNEVLTALLMQRARIVGAAANKLDALRQIMSMRLQTSHTLFYCGDGSVEDEVTEESDRQLEAARALLQDELGYRVKTYTAETSLEEREELRYQFMQGTLQGLVAIRCLDEGVDIPAIQTAVILASSSNPRQFVQRRGRILRPSPGKERAELFDIIVIPPDLGRESWSIERNLLRKELKRFVEFADLSLNSGQARKVLLPLQEKYQLLEL